MDAVAYRQKITHGRIRYIRSSQKKSQKRRNPRTGETISIPAAEVPKFIAGKVFREAIK